MGDPFTDFFKMIGDLFIQIANIFIQLIQHTGDIGNIFNMIFCPITIFTNIHICAYYWSFDILFFLLWGIIWALIFVLISGPLYLSALAIYICLGERCKWESAISGGPAFLCPSKDNFFNFFENMYRFFSNGRFLYRNSDDIKKCYCIPALILFLNPFTNFESYNSDKGGSGNENKTSLIFPFIILSLVVLSNYSK